MTREQLATLVSLILLALLVAIVVYDAIAQGKEIPFHPRMEIISPILMMLSAIVYSVFKNKKR